MFACQSGIARPPQWPAADRVLALTPAGVRVRELRAST
eukprot:CAMPEP_0206007294 /NCGR_PEP_ID=MMETSP1464-20131121/5683_1 /ASSEMBLY_ACC=CAM_ASM_001124 /TAXON_ID=119497 /ORGANISM="Exanthemachrysis gayraliae, Strain RCC1523" /LENGTH=37 /DNA_ID= /DNA_START= /DNA_END= /DNA_ORIENTATION=